MMRWIVRLLREEDGPTAVEYSVMLAMIVIACLGAIQAVGTQTNSVWQGMNTSLTNAGFGK